MATSDRKSKSAAAQSDDSAKTDSTTTDSSDEPQVPKETMQKMEGQRGVSRGEDDEDNVVRAGGRARGRTTGNQRRETDQDPVPGTLSEMTPDTEARVGFFCRVVEGKYTGRYGVLLEHNTDSDEAVIQTRDEDSARLIVNYNELRLDQPGRR